MTKMAKIDTLFMTKTAEKQYPLGPGRWDELVDKIEKDYSPLMIS